MNQKLLIESVTRVRNAGPHSFYIPTKSVLQVPGLVGRCEVAVILLKDL